MKVVIIEGLDNTGKTTLIQGLMQEYGDVYYMHATKPQIKDPIECALAQTKSFQGMVESIRNMKDKLSNPPSLVILDRSWVGEYVYGCLYRGNGDSYVKKMIHECYRELDSIGSALFPFNYTTILLEATPEFCAKNDDGQSISWGDVEKIEKERQRFEEIMLSEHVMGKKKIINVECQGEFISKEIILKSAITAIEWNGIQDGKEEAARTTAGDC